MEDADCDTALQSSWSACVMEVPTLPRFPAPDRQNHMLRPCPCISCDLLIMALIPSASFGSEPFWGTLNGAVTPAWHQPGSCSFTRHV